MGSYLIKKIFYLLLLSVVTLQAQIVKQHWNDSVRVCIIWNSGTGSDGMPRDWQQSVGEIGDSTRAFVRRALGTLHDSQIREFSGISPEWSFVSQSVDNLKREFNGELPHVIVYVNAGYEWDQARSMRSPTPYPLLREAADSGVGIVAVGDDAAYDGKQIFPLTGPGGVGDPIQFHSQTNNAGISWPWMGDGLIYEGWGNSWTPVRGYEKLLIWLDREENSRLPDQGLLYGVEDDTLHFKRWERGGRGQADADIWDVDVRELDNYAFIGFQYGDLDGSGDPWQTIPKPADDERLFKVIATLQNDLNRVVMLCYQPQYLENERASKQILYNSLYWASKAKEMMKLSTPVADPATGSPNVVGQISLKIEWPLARELYEIWYSIDGAEFQLYTGSFPLPQTGDGVELRAYGRATRPEDWFNSDTLFITYEYVRGPILREATLHPGAIEDREENRFYPDTLVVTFDKPVERISSNRPFRSVDSDENGYRFLLRLLEFDANKARFEIEGYENTSSNYMPKDGEDSLWIDSRAGIKGVDGTIQDDPHNRRVSLKVLERSLPRISTPKADPDKGITQSVSFINLSVDAPLDRSLYTIRYEFDGEVTSESPEYSGEFNLPSHSDDVVLRAVAFSSDPSRWRDSDTLKVVYEYVAPPRLDSVVYRLGGIEDFSTSKVGPDTLFAYFDISVDEISVSQPFLSWDGDGESYQFSLKNHSRKASSVQVFIVESAYPKEIGYLPVHKEDSITIDPDAHIRSSSSGAVQDGSNNRRVPLFVRAAPMDLHISAVWYDGEEDRDLYEFLDGVGFSFTEGVLILIDPRARVTPDDLQQFRVAINILDMLGNRVASLSSINRPGAYFQTTTVEIGGRQQYAILWNARNMMGRRVGAAAYLLFVELSDGGETRVQQHFKIPVKHPQ